MAAALSRTPRPDALVVLTDGQTAWPANRPPCRTVVGVFPRASQWKEERDYRPEMPPDWARVVRLG